MERFDSDVVVVGAGAAGLAAAVTLGQNGVSTLVVEQRLDPSTLPRATIVSTRAMELLRSWGLEDDVRAGGVDGDAVLWECETLARANEGRAYEVGYPTRAQAAVVSPTAPGLVPQDWLEAVMRRHVHTLASVDFELGTQLMAIDNRPDCVVVTLRDRSHRVRTVRTRYVVGADGAYSAVRRMVGISVSGEPDIGLSGIQVVFRAPLWELLGDLRCVLYSVTNPSAPGIFLPAGATDRWVYGPAAPWDVEHPPDVDPDRIAELIRDGVGVAIDVRVERIGPFQSPGELADRFRAGRVFLAGDAAHRVTPRGGTGMNVAFLSGYDLGWKLAWVLQGWAEPTLLDTYEEERRPVAEHHVARSTDPYGSRRPAVGELAVDLGGRIPHVWLPGFTGRASTLDLLGPVWTLFTTSVARGERAASRLRAPVTLRVLDPMTARALGMQGGDLLVRPDGVPFSLESVSTGVPAVRRVTEYDTAVA